MKLTTSPLNKKAIAYIGELIYSKRELDLNKDVAFFSENRNKKICSLWLPTKLTINKGHGLFDWRSTPWGDDQHRYMHLWLVFFGIHLMIAKVVIYKARDK